MRMRNSAIATLSVVTLLLPVHSLTAQVPPGGSEGPAPPPARKIPGINVTDQFPRGCVDCHVNRPGIGLDVRLSTLMARWNDKVEPALLAKAQAAAPPDLTLKGKHPAVARALADIPAGCLACHARASKVAPPFAQMVHSIHLTGGEENHFMTLFQGECTHCHKLDAASGRWFLVSGAER